MSNPNNGNTPPPDPNNGGNTPPNPNTPPPAPAYEVAPSDNAYSQRREEHVANRLNGMDERVSEERNTRESRLSSDISKLEKAIEADKDNDNISQDVKDGQATRLLYLKDKLANHANVDDITIKQELAQQDLEKARQELAKHTAARRDNVFTLRTGRKGQVKTAQAWYEVAAGVKNRLKIEASVDTDGMSPEDAKRAKDEAALKNMLGDGTGSGDAELFNLNDETTDQRLLNTGVYKLDENGRAVPKDTRWAKIQKGAFSTWNRWNEQGKWGKAKQIAAVAAGGIVLGAAAKLVGVGIAGAAGVGLAVRAAKGAAANRVARKAEQMRAHRDSDNTAGDLITELNNGNEGGLQDKLQKGELNTADEFKRLVEENFVDVAQNANKKNRKKAAVVGATAIVGATAGMLLEGMVNGAEAGENPDQATDSAAGTSSSSATPTTTTNAPSSSASPSSSETSSSTSTTTTSPNSSSSARQSSSSAPTTTTTSGRPSVSSSVSSTTTTSAPISSSFRPEQSASGQSTTTTSTTESKPPVNTQGREEKVIDKPKAPQSEAEAEAQAKTEADAKAKAEAEAKAKQVPPATEKAPDSKIIKMDVIKKGDFVSNVYVDQLGNGGYAEMLSNAKEAAEAGEIEKYDINTGKVVPDSDKTGNFYYRLTERGALRHGAPVGSSSTGDVLKVLADHSKKFTLVG